MRRLSDFESPLLPAILDNLEYSASADGSKKRLNGSRISAAVARIGVNPLSIISFA